MNETLHRYARRLRKHAKRIELSILVLIGLVAGGLWIFLEVADAVLEGESHRLDRAILLAMRTPSDRTDPIGPHWVEELGRDITALGGVGVLVLFTLATIGYLLITRRRHTAGFVLAAVGSGFLMSTLLKLGFDRPRPDLVPHASYVYSASFPSGHSMMAAVTYLTLAALLTALHPYRLAKLYILAVAVFLTLAVGLSRVYLGVHWPTDVLAGWAAGAIWAMLCWLAALWIRNRRTGVREALR